MPEVLWPVLVSVAGAAVGSFAAAAGVRTCADDDSLLRRSACPRCGHRLGMSDLVPLLSYALLGGRCRYCGQRIPLLYPAMEVLGALALLASWLVHGTGWGFWRSGLMGLLALQVSVSDVQCRLVHAGVCAVVAAASLAVAAADPGTSALASALAGASYAGFLALVRWIWLVLRGKEAMGMGDVILAFPIGVALGSTDAVLLAAAATFAGAAVIHGAVYLLTREREVPLGAYMTWSAFLVSLLPWTG